MGNNVGFLVGKDLAKTFDVVLLYLVGLAPSQSLRLGQLLQAAPGNPQSLDRSYSRHRYHVAVTFSITPRSQSVLNSSVIALQQ